MAHGRTKTLNISLIRILTLLLSACEMLSCFLLFLSPFATSGVSCKEYSAVWQSSNRFRAWELQDGYRSQQGSSFFSSAAHQSCIVWPYNTLISSISVSLSFSVALFHFLSLSSCQENTHLTAQQWGPGLCHRQPVCSCSAMFYSICSYKPAAHEQLLPHTSTHKHTCMLARRYYICLKMLIYWMHKNKSLFLRYFCSLMLCVRRQGVTISLPLVPVWADKGNRWGLKRRWGGQTETGSKDRGTERENERRKGKWKKWEWGKAGREKLKGRNEEWVKGSGEKHWGRLRLRWKECK